MPGQTSFDYAVIRVVPNVEREEFVNVGVILFCRTRRFLSCRIEFNAERLSAIAPTVDLEGVQAHLAILAHICEGGVDAGPIGQLDMPERFHWLVAPRSTTLQISPVHCGLCTDPERALEQMFDRLVRR
ncbi:MAG: DUF3037 domain-containing protein [Chloroflexi bacterium]|nr:DUF3037 domain-containing protein [Chloroflexota bacterium]